MDESLSPENVIRRCLLDFIRRGGVNEDNIGEVAFRVAESLRLILDIAALKGTENGRSY